MSSRPLPTVAMDVVRGTFLEAASRGFEVHALCERFGVSSELLLTVDARVPVDQQEIAFLLGFSEQSAFQHAFVRWTGRSPGAYRAQSARQDRTRA